MLKVLLDFAVLLFSCSCLWLILKKKSIKVKFSTSINLRRASKLSFCLSVTGLCHSKSERVSVTTTSIAEWGP